MAKAGRARAGRRGAAAICGAALALVLAAAPAPAAVVGQWRFDESGGQTVVDDAPFGLAGGLGTTADADSTDPERIAGASGGALRFDGDSLVRLPNSPVLALQSLTAEAVVRAPESPGSWRYVLSRGGKGCQSGSYGLYTAPAGGLALYVFDGSGFVLSATARPEDVWDGGWHHVAGTFDGEQLRLYIDGRPVGAPMDARLRVDYSTTSDVAYIGQYAGTCDLPFRGDVDLVRLSSDALSAPAVALAARAAFPHDDASPPPAAPAPLPAAAPGTVIPGGGAVGSTPGGSAQACTVRLSRTRIASRRRSVVQARVALPAGSRVAVIARRARHAKPVATARTDAKGVARLVLKVKRSGRLTVSVDGRPSCTPAQLTVSG